MGKGTLMKIAAVPAYERERLKALNDYYILDTSSENDFDDITEMASMICNVPISLITFIDANRQYIKSQKGLPKIWEIPRNESFDDYAIDNSEEILVVNDLARDDRFSNDFFVVGPPNALFYAGAPLVSPEGYVLGTLSVLDIKPNDLDVKQVKALQALARQVVTLLELRKKNRLAAQKQLDLFLAQTDLEQIAFLASHDLKTPLNNILSLVDLLKSEYGTALGNDGKEYIQYISEAANVAAGMITGILTFSRAAKMPVKKDFINVDELVNDVLETQIIPENTTITIKGDSRNIYIPVELVKRILQQLIKNAIQYKNKSYHEVEIIFQEEKNNYVFEVNDTGEGIDAGEKENAFVLFKRLKDRDKTPENMGVGLAIVKRLVEKIGGNVTVDSDPGQGSSFTFTIPK